MSEKDVVNSKVSETLSIRLKKISNGYILTEERDSKDGYETKEIYFKNKPIIKVKGE